MADAGNQRDDIDALVARCYPAIRQMAAARTRLAGARLDATSIANEALCRVLRSSQVPKSEDHLRALSWRALDWVIRDRQRADGARREREHDRAAPEIHEPESLTFDQQAMQELAAHNERKAEVFVLSAVAGMTFEQIAKALSVSVRTVQRDYEFAHAFLVSRDDRGAEP